MTISPCSKPVSKAFDYVAEWSDDFLALFPHRGSFLYAEHPAPGQRPEWHTETRHLLSDRLIRQGAYLYGVRFGSETNYLMLDIDHKSAYHPYRDRYAVGRILEALEPLGLVSYVAVTSSYSDGVHLYFPFTWSQPSWAIAQAAALLLEHRGFKLNRGQLELFPNPRRFAGADYHGHRLPLQAGSYLLNSDWECVFSTHDRFVEQWRFAQNRNSSVCRELIDRVFKTHERKTIKRFGIKAQKFLSDLNAEIEPGWTGFGQTNHLLGKIAQREYIFHHALYGGDPLTGIRLQLRILEVATSLPGYREWCRHHHDLPQLAVYWARSIEFSDNYYPYRGEHMKRPSPPDEEMPLTPNQQRALDARERIRSAVAHLVEQGMFPDTVRARVCALQQFGISSQTLYKNKDLWHVEKQLESAPNGAFHAIGEDSADLQSLKASSDEVFQAVGLNKLVHTFAPAPQEQGARCTEVMAVGGARGGFSTTEGFPQCPNYPPRISKNPPHEESIDHPPSSVAEPPSHVLEAIRFSLARARAQTRRRITPPPDEVIPDENYFRQLEIAVWRE